MRNLNFKVDKYFQLIGIFFLLTNFAVPKENLKEYKEWINVGIGYGNIFEFHGGINYNFGWNKYYYQIGIMCFQPLNINIGEMNFNNGYLNKSFNSVNDKNTFTSENMSRNNYSLESLKSINVCAGIRKFHRFYLISLFLGPGLILGEKTFDEYNDDFITLGLTTNSQFFVKPIAEIGIGLQLYGILNPEKNVYGILLTLHFNNTK